MHDENREELKEYAAAKLNLTSDSVPENAAATTWETISLKYKYLGTPATSPALQSALRIWVSGDTSGAFNWKQVGDHLRGFLKDKNYEPIGYVLFSKEGSSINDNKSDAERVSRAKEALDAAAATVNGGLDTLPSHDGVSYRMAGVESKTVYGGKISVGDYIKDKAFWSTSALRISGSAGQWGTDGTEANPKVYFIINGSTGKYISKHAQQEEGQHEVLFKNGVPFRVTKIGNYKYATFFVYLDEVPLVDGMVIKNPYNGNVYED
ncbi:MAG: hypothetical protein AAF828_01650 [Bacteroidota bacterium]